MSTFPQRFDNIYHTIQSQRSYLKSKGYYSDSGVIRWEPTNLVEVEPENRFGPRAATRAEIDNYDWRDCEEF